MPPELPSYNVCNIKYWFQIVCGVKLLTSIFTAVQRISPLVFLLYLYLCLYLYLYLYFCVYLFKLLTSIFTKNSTICLPFVPTINQLRAALLPSNNNSAKHINAEKALFRYNFFDLKSYFELLHEVERIQIIWSKTWKHKRSLFFQGNTHKCKVCRRKAKVWN